MSFDNLSTEKKFVLVTGFFVFFTFFAAAVLMEQTTEVTQFGKDKYMTAGSLPIAYSDLSTSSSDAKKLKAIVKGSIYENGSNMTVYGACFDGDSYLLPAAEAKFTAWYPDGSIMIGPNATMDKIYYDLNGYSPNGTGRWKIHVTMGDVIGTYLTEMRCEYNGDWAIAFGEWQNPEWVARIAQTQSTLGDTYSLLQNVSTQITVFENNTNNTLNDILLQIGTPAVVQTPGGIRELKQSLDALDLNQWFIDETNPFYVLGSDTHNFVAVEMLSPQRVAAVSSDGYMVQWDGESWVEYQPDSGAVEFRGVSLLPANTVYFWGVGTLSGNPVISVNGANASTYTPPSGSPAALNDVRLFQQPNNPSGSYYALLLADTGEVYFSDDSAATWSTLGTVDSGNLGRISQVVDNVDPYDQVDGWASLIGQGDMVAWTDGVTFDSFNLPGYDVKDVSLIYYDLGWVIAEGASDSKIYQFNGTDLTLQYIINDSNVVPTSIQALEQNNVWATTTDPSTLFFYNGRTWEYSTVGLSQLVSVVIDFGNASSSFGLRDSYLFDDRHGYAVGGDGLILVFESESKVRYDNIVSMLDQLNYTVSAGFLDINNTINLTSAQTQALVSSINSSISQLVLDVNSSLSYDISTVQSTLSVMNASIELNFANVLNNVTYTQLYLENTLFPLANMTYQNTLQILADLGIIQAQLNESIQLQNDTLSIVNATASDVDELVNRSRRIRAWITQ